MRRVAAVAAVLSLAVWVAGAARADDKNRAAKDNSRADSSADTHFLKEAAMGGMAEVMLGKMAQERAANPMVKALGQRIAEDHAQANRELKRLADQKGLELPKDLNGKQKDVAKRLSELRGADFDRDYVKHMVKDHEHDIKDFQKEADNGQDADLKAFAAKSLPVLRQHLEMARQAQQAVGGGERK